MNPELDCRFSPGRFSPCRRSPIGISLVWVLFQRLVFVFMLFLAGCSPAAERHRTLTVSSSRTFGVRNFTVVRVDPNGRTVDMDWKEFNTLTGSAFRVPYEEIRLSDGTESYLISSESAGNNELIVNGRPYSFDSQSQQLLIQFGSGVSIEPGGDFEQAE